MKEEADNNASDEISKPDDIRVRALQRLKLSQTEANVDNLSDIDVRRLVQELQIHQIELEMQNETLRQSQLELEISRARYSDLYDFAPVGYLTIDDRYVVTEANLTATRMLETSRSLMLGRHFSAYVAEDYLKSYYRYLKDVFSSREVMTCELRLVGKGGTDFYAKLEGIVLAFGDGLRCCRVVISDITGQKKMEEEIKTMNLNLQQRVDEEVAKNREKDKKMYEQFHYIAMGELLFNIAHHWRQPLCAVGLLIQNIRDAYLHDELNSTELEYSVETAMSELRGLSKTIDDFKDFYIHDTKKVNINIAQEINKSLALMSGYIKDKGIVIDRHLDESITFDGCPNELVKVVLIVLANIRDAFSRKNVADGVIKISLYKGLITNKIIITVMDNGGGIEEDMINKVFDPYFTTKDKKRGTGMGLYMAKRIIEHDMYGTISIRNVDGWCEVRIEI
ncbi:MAG: PAS domain-containing sensor histidine kinase [Candidatus Magnetobacterium sp. LHC-1]|nr:PAS domain-containing sensor histidine kinase [Nitrospirota bacterium]